MSSPTLSALVYAIRWEANEVVSVELRPATGEVEFPPFEAGSHINLHLPNGLSRSYSLCNSDAERDNFADAVDFIGWYIDQTARYNGIAKTDAYQHYLAYHEGQGGFAKGTHRQKAWLIERARRVRQQAERYRVQLSRCERRLALRS